MKLFVYACIDRGEDMYKNVRFRIHGEGKKIIFLRT